MISQSKELILEGIRKCSNAVGSTMGPFGNDVYIKIVDGGLLIVKDGVTVLRHIVDLAHIEQIGQNVLADASGKTEEIAGDGTTRTVVLSYGMCNAIHGLLTKKKSRFKRRGKAANRWRLKQDMDIIFERLSGVLDSLSLEPTMERMIGVATTSLNGESVLGKLVGALVYEQGDKAVIEVKKSQDDKHRLEYEKGYTLPTGFVSPQFNPNEQKVVIEDAYVLLINDVISDWNKFEKSYMGILRGLLMPGPGRKIRPLVIIAEDFEGSALASMVANYTQANIPIFPIKCPQTGDRKKQVFEDLRVLTGAAVVFDDKAGVTVETRGSFKVSDMGSSEKVTVSKTGTIILGDGDVKERAEAISKEYNSSEVIDMPEYRSYLLRRYMGLTKGVATIYLKRGTHIDTLWLDKQVEDAILACKGAMRTGIVPGGGSIEGALLKALTGDSMAEFILHSGLKEVLLCLSQNSEDPIQPYKDGYVYMPHQGYVPVDVAQVYDSKEVVYWSIRNALSLSQRFLVSKYIISPDEN